MVAQIPVPPVEFRDGRSIPMVCPRSAFPEFRLTVLIMYALQLGFGVGTAWMDKKKADRTDIDTDLIEAIKKAIKMGYRHFDGAQGLLFTAYKLRSIIEDAC